MIAYLTLGSSSSSTTAATRTSTVQRGVVLTSVSASGAVQSSDDVSASFPTSGTLIAVLAGSEPARAPAAVREPVGSAAVTKTETTTIVGIHPGDAVLAIGTAGKNGTVAATQVRVTPAATS